MIPKPLSKIDKYYNQFMFVIKKTPIKGLRLSSQNKW